MDAFETYTKANELRHGGEHAYLGYLIAGENPVALDIFEFSKLKKIEPQFKNKEWNYIKHIQHAINIGVGESEYMLEKILI